MATDTLTRPSEVAINYEDEVAHLYCNLVLRSLDGPKVAVCGYSTDDTTPLPLDTEKCLMCLETAFCSHCGHPVST